MNTDASDVTPASAVIDVPIRFSRWFVPLGFITGMRPRDCHVRVSAAGVEVAMGWAFRARIPRGVVASAHASDVGPWAGVGVHGWRGTWVVNGAQDRLVELRLSQPVAARAVGLPIQLRRLLVSVDDPDELVRVLGQD